MIEQKIIDKYIERIKVDYPEDDKLMIDLIQFAAEVVNNCNTPDVSVEKRRVCDCSKQVGSLHLPTNEFTCWNCGKITKETES